MAIITVTSYKESGKYYSESRNELKEEHKNLFGFDLVDLIKQNHSSVISYSGLSCGFLGDFYYVISVDYGEENNFCNFVLDKVGYN